MNEPIAENFRDDILELDPQEENELVFHLSVQGSKPAFALTKLILGLESEELHFRGHVSNGDATFVLPAHVWYNTEATYLARLEVFVETRYVPLANFKLEFRLPLPDVALAPFDPEAAFADVKRRIDVVAKRVNRTASRVRRT